MTPLRGWLIASLVLAALACGLPFLTHFADGGLSILLFVLWLISLVIGFARFGWRGVWFLLGAPLGLFWVVTLILVAPDIPLSF